MPGRRPKVLTEAELELMDTMWELGEATAQSIQEASPSSRKPSNSTVRTILRGLEQKGYVRHRAEGRIYVYEPVLGRDEAARKMVQDVAHRISGGSAKVLIQRILELERNNH